MLVVEEEKPREQSRLAIVEESLKVDADFKLTFCSHDGRS